ncbi:hypothetical protein [Bradyrhizobium forestalis]|nr:hypothetical protein [Bradyrhizobium forestalis]
MLATLNSKQIVDEIVKDTVKDNDPHDAVQISPEVVLVPRPGSAAPALAPDISPRPEPKFAPTSVRATEPTFNVVYGKPAAAAPPIDTAVRVTVGDAPSRRKRSAVGKWLRGAFVTFLFAGASAAATIVWEKHGDTAKQMFAEWKPVLASLLPATSQTPPVATAQAAPPAAPAVAEQTPDQSVPPPSAQAAVTQAAATQVAVAPAATQPDTAQSVQSMTNDLAAMAQQIEQLKANIAELKAGQEQLAREMAKPPAPKPVAAETRPVDPRPRAAVLPPQPAAAPVRKPKPAVTRTYMPAYSPAPLAPPPSQAAAAPPPAAPVATTQAVADDDGPVVRPPMPLR